MFSSINPMAHGFVLSKRMCPGLRKRFSIASNMGETEIGASALRTIAAVFRLEWRPFVPQLLNCTQDFYGFRFRTSPVDGIPENDCVSPHWTRCAGID